MTSRRFAGVIWGHCIGMKGNLARAKSKIGFHLEIGTSAWRVHLADHAWMNAWHNSSSVPNLASWVILSPGWNVSEPSTHRQSSSAWITSTHLSLQTTGHPGWKSNDLSRTKAASSARTSCTTASRGRNRRSTPFTGWARMSWKIMFGLLSLLSRAYALDDFFIFPSKSRAARATDSKNFYRNGSFRGINRNANWSTMHTEFTIVPPITKGWANPLARMIDPRPQGHVDDWAESYFLSHSGQKTEVFSLGGSTGHDGRGTQELRVEIPFMTLLNGRNFARNNPLVLVAPARPRQAFGTPKGSASVAADSMCFQTSMYLSSTLALELAQTCGSTFHCNGQGKSAGKGQIWRGTTLESLANSPCKTAWSGHTSSKIWHPFIRTWSSGDKKQ